MDPALLQQLGLIVITWGQVEALTGELLERMLKATPGTLYAITPTVSHSTLIGWIRTLAADRFQRREFRNEVLEALNDLDELRAERNALVHGTWGGGPAPNTAMVHSVRLDRVDVITDSLVTLTELNQLRSALQHALDRLRKIIRAIDPTFP